MLIALTHIIERLILATPGLSQINAQSAAEGAHASQESIPELPTLITFLKNSFPDVPLMQFIGHYETQVFSLAFAGLIIVLAHFSTRNKSLIPHKLQNAMEMLVEYLDDLLCGIVGPDGTKYLPFIGTLFIYILFMNLAGTFPLLKSPTNSWNTTVALALCVFIYVQGVGIKHNGIFGYIFHLMGSPRDTVSWVLMPLMFPLHVMGELIKPVSLSLRLFGNIFGEDLLIVAFVGLGVGLGKFFHSPVGIPLQFPFLFLQLLTDVVQTLVFSLLATIYIFLMLPHEEHGHETR